MHLRRKELPRPAKLRLTSVSIAVMLKNRLHNLLQCHSLALLPP